MKYLILITFLLSNLQSAPAFSKSRVLKQENGVTFIGQSRGDEYLHWIESEDGEILKYNPESKNYELAEIKDGYLKPSGKKYVSGLKQSNGLRKSSGLNNSNLKSQELYKLWDKKREAHRLRMHPSKKRR